MNEILKKWNDLCKGVVIKINETDTIVFNYAVVEIAAHGNNPYFHQTHLSGGGVATSSGNSYHIEYKEIKSQTRLLSGENGQMVFGEKWPKDFIDGSKAVVLFVQYPKSENKDEINSIAAIHLKSGKIYVKENPFNGFFKAHNIGSFDKVSKVVGVHALGPKKHRLKNIFLATIVSGLAVPILFEFGFKIFAQFGILLVMIFGGLLGLSVLSSLIGSLFGQLFGLRLGQSLSQCADFILDAMSKDAPTLWQELENQSGN